MRLALVVVRGPVAWVAIPFLWLPITDLPVSAFLAPDHTTLSFKCKDFSRGSDRITLSADGWSGRVPAATVFAWTRTVQKHSPSAFHGAGSSECLRNGHVLFFCPFVYSAFRWGVIVCARSVLRSAFGLRERMHTGHCLWSGSERRGLSRWVKDTMLPSPVPRVPSERR